MRKYNENPKFPKALPQTPPQLCPGPAGGLTNPQLIIAIAAWSFSQNSKKNEQLIFPYFNHWKIANSAKNNIDISFAKKSTPYPKNKGSE